MSLLREAAVSTRQWLREAEQGTAASGTSGTICSARNASVPCPKALAPELVRLQLDALAATGSSHRDHWQQTRALLRTNSCRVHPPPALLDAVPVLHKPLCTPFQHMNGEHFETNGYDAQMDLQTRSGSLIPFYGIRTSASTIAQRGQVES